MGRTIIKNGFVITSTEQFKADVLIEEGTIVSLSESFLEKQDDLIIDATDKYVFPGGIDAHVHLDIPGTVDGFESGTKAAALGGITSIINYADPVKEKSFIETLQEWKKKAKPSYIDYGIHSIINRCDDETLKEIPLLAKEGVTSIKLFMAYKDTVMVNDLELYKLMKKAGESGVVTNIHAENGDVIDELIKEKVEAGYTAPKFHADTRPASLEAEATNRALKIANVAKAPVYIVHVTCEEALNEVKRALEDGINAFAETCPHYLVLDRSYLELPNFEGAKYVCSPPLREKSDQNALWEGLYTGIISTIGSDHASIPFEGGKTRGRNDFSKIPNGCPGIESSFSLLYHYGVQGNRITLQQFVQKTSTNPAKIFGLYPKKGEIALGSDADIVIFDPQKSSTISAETQAQNTDYNIYEGTKIEGSISHVLSKGKIIVENNIFKGEKGHGEYLHRKTFNKIDSKFELVKN
ncbi:dihydropyrimidinase [Domibacillus indicus]|uniref:dihydropyrimidinase n=1 Tax=Domibacillus indicus TaxID=1437523 RepID=UPI000617E6B7|nr:dihydropyrimidinase [Domibacillus indicus]